MAVKPYKLRVPDAIAALIRSLHPQLKRKVRAALQLMQNDPTVGKPLKHELAGLRSFRIGRFRLVYRIEPERVIALVAIGPRSRIYAETYRMISQEAREK